MVYTILQPAGRWCGGAAAANFLTADYAVGRTPTKMQPAPMCSLCKHAIPAALAFVCFSFLFYYIL